MIENDLYIQSADEEEIEDENEYFAQPEEEDIQFDDEEYEEEEEVDDEEEEEVPELEESEPKEVSEVPKVSQKPLREVDITSADNANFYLATKYFYDDRNYEEAIKMYEAVLAEESDKYLVVKSMYLMAESYVKLKRTDDAISAFENLTQRFADHYLSASAQRRIAHLEEIYGGEDE